MTLDSIRNSCDVFSRDNVELLQQKLAEVLVWLIDALLFFGVFLPLIFSFLIWLISGLGAGRKRVEIQQDLLSGELFNSADSQV